MLKRFVVLCLLAFAVGDRNYQAQNAPYRGEDDNGYTCGDFCDLRCGESACDDSNDCTLDLAIGGGVESNAPYNPYGYSHAQPEPPKACEHLAKPPGTECNLGTSSGVVAGQCLDGRCIDLSSDEENCGAIALKCVHGEKCCNGTCASLTRGLLAEYYDRGSVINASGKTEEQLDELCVLVFEAEINETRVDNPTWPVWRVDFGSGNPFGRNSSFTGIGAEQGQPGRSCFSIRWSGYLKMLVTSAEYRISVFANDRANVTFADQQFQAEFPNPTNVQDLFFQQGQCVPFIIEYGDDWNPQGQGTSLLDIEIYSSGMKGEIETFQTLEACQCANT